MRANVVIQLDSRELVGLTYMTTTVFPQLNIFNIQVSIAVFIEQCVFLRLFHVSEQSKLRAQAYHDLWSVSATLNNNVCMADDRVASGIYLYNIRVLFMIMQCYATRMSD